MYTLLDITIGTVWDEGATAVWIPKEVSDPPPSMHRAGVGVDVEIIKVN